VIELKESLPYPDPQSAFFSGAPWKTMGTSAGGRDVTGLLLEHSNNAPRVFLLGGVHGNETEGVAFMEGFVREFADETWKSLGVNLFLLPVLNPDGFLGFKRQNDNGVDLNRNMSTKDWTPVASEPKYFPGPSSDSEPETKILLSVLNDYKPEYIISFHSWKPMVNINGPAHAMARTMGEKLNYILTEDIGYPTPGSLGTYAGWERQIPTITLEFERGMDPAVVYGFAREGILSSLETFINSR